MIDTDFIGWTICMVFIGFCVGFMLASFLWERLVDKQTRHMDWLRERAGL